MRGGGGDGGGVKNVEKMPPPFRVESNGSYGFFSILSQKSVSTSRLHAVCMGRSGTSAYGVYALFSHFCYVGGFGDLGDPVLPTVRGAIGHFLTIYAYQDTKGCFLQALAFPRPGHGLCKRREMTAYAVYAVCTHFCYVGVFGDLGDRAVPFLRCARGDVATTYAY